MPITATVDIKYSTGASFHMGLTPEEAQKVIDFLFTLRAPHSTGTAGGWSTMVLCAVDA